MMNAIISCAMLNRNALKLFTILVAFVPGPVRAEETTSPGQAIYNKMCIDCHGKQGEGVESVYSQSLIGDLSIQELTAYIEKTMPEGEPEKCVGDDAESVARYIHESFYSVTAQARNQKARIDLSRLTVDQYRNSVIDLVQSFTWRRSLGEKRGLRAEYFKSRRRSKDNRVVERIDERVEFDFGNEPQFLSELIKKQDEEKANQAEKQDEKDKNPPVQDEYSVTWSGSLYAPDTGLYRLNFKTKNSGQLWFNNEREPLIDARVKSGDQTDYTASVILQAGRLYPLRIEYFKNKTEQEGSVQLRWTRPHHTEELVSTRYLVPESSSWTILIDTPFPPDDKSVGYERGTSVSPEWDDATTFAALEVADKILEKIESLAKLPKQKEKHRELLKQFCESFTERAFRRPLSAQDRTLYIDHQFDQAESDLIAVKRVILLTLKSPRFLFPGAANPDFDDFRVAEWLSLAIWDSLPDERLLQAAAAGKLSEQREIELQVRRMMQDDRTRAKMRSFFHQWLNVDHYHDLSKAEGLYPGFSAELLADQRTSLDLFVDEVVWSESSDYRLLLRSAQYPLNGRLANYYGVPHPGHSEFQTVSLEPDQRAGLLTHPFLLTGLAYDDASSPIHRGVFMSRSLLGRFLKPPPIAVAPLPVDLHPGMTTRERVAKQTSSATCMACHGMINELGFTLEHFDAVGKYRETEFEKPVNVAGQYLNRQGEKTEFQGARGLSEYLVSSEEAHNAFVEQMFQFVNKQPIQAFGAETLQKLRSEFVANGFHIRQLIGDIAIESAIIARRQKER
jgi:cytochrome c553